MFKTDPLYDSVNVSSAGNRITGETIEIRKMSNGRYVVCSGGEIIQKDLNYDEAYIVFHGIVDSWDYRNK